MTSGTSMNALSKRRFTCCFAYTMAMPSLTRGGSIPTAREMFPLVAWSIVVLLALFCGCFVLVFRLALGFVCILYVAFVASHRVASRRAMSRRDMAHFF